MHRELSVTLGHTKLPVPKSLSHFLPQPLLPAINFIDYMNNYVKEEMEKDQHASVQPSII